MADMESAGWIEDAFDDEADLALLHVAVPASEGAWTELDDPVPPGLITLVAPDLDRLVPAKR